MKDLMDEIYLKYITRKNESRPYVVGIDGLGGAGKTTFVHKLQLNLREKCDLNIIHMDDHIVERQIRYDTRFPEWYEYYYLQWDVALLTDQLFEKIHKNAGPLILPHYDKGKDKITDMVISFSTNSLFLIEGVFIQRNEWRSYFDEVIFLDCPKEERYKRVLERDTYIGNKQAILEKYEKRYWRAEQFYVETENPLKKATKVFKWD